MKKAIKQSKLVFLLNMSAIILLIITIAQITLTISQSKATDKVNINRYNLSEYATHFMNASSYLTGEVRAFAATGDTEHYNNYSKELNETRTRETSIEMMKEIGLSSTEQELVDEMMASSNALLPSEKKAIEIAKTGDYKEAAKTVLSPE